ncbi:membrane-bound alpha-1,6- mannosyltransferase Initiation-specific [Pichia californica]|uniref:Membrane-bound alpha-1,6- mannosyltransferase Initiation-specific n=1 Tax=Pichia californica TaxID=460514 RepID=A0A9P6WJN9_9ASCO|nr:membrane-bound alpha-1,6- mannosyltransferase Initiation-specific [[Candida] californica]KAG0688064.1 membrane-bound alpha-1,6- mannosyltransferase Initiation-specific [[Candida] californica]
MYRRLGSREQSSIGGPTDTFKLSIKGSLLLINQFKILLIASLSVFLFCSLFLNNSVSTQLEALRLLDNSSNSTTWNFYSKESPPSLNIKSLTSIEKRLRYYFPFDNNNDIENNIWQLWNYRADDSKFPSKCFTHMERWRVANLEYNHNLITLDEAQIQFFDSFSYDMPEIVNAYNLLPDTRLKYDFLKYLIVFINGGIYADIDTLDAKPLKFWYESTLKPSKMMVGIDVDYNDVNWDILYNRRLTFSTKIFKSKSHHPFLAKLIARIVYTIYNSIDEINSIDWNQAYQNVDSNDEPLIQFTSASIFTDTLFDYFNQLNNPVVHRVARTDKDLIPEQIFGPETNKVFSYKLFTLSRGPTQVDDIVIMPQITFKGPTSGYHRGALNFQSYDTEYDDENEKDDYYYARPLHFLSWDSLVEHKKVQHQQKLSI